MTDPDRNPDSPPADRPSDIERAVSEDRGNRDITNVQEDEETPLEPTVSPDTAGGAGGVVRNQDDDAQ
ncbi:hypothetical protein COC42_01370 [Sphingomonas spermidinifaciens]|uniref:Uncharacterized protein n=1 Tax=Sphingomonas spermidinifaciens TaxID=1141889 RepID=A0A2A4B1N5_9SPHN|nr:hypothetical protein [Sphingomonas spermidinifaciens]PCD03103.1 hypothetical protein COC42_01370 [Sphingomonas spermidinifaciens]